MATKSKASKKPAGRKRKNILDGDPPILVGGGGSAYIWVNLDQNERPVNPQSNDPSTGIKPGAPTPLNRGNYTCHRVTRTPPTIVFFDGVSSTGLVIRDTKNWYIRID